MTINTSRFYPSPSTVTYYIGSLWIDDIFRVDFQRKVNYQPIWGYDSRKYDFVAKGKEIVTGNIIINYRYPGYLRAAILNADSNSKYTTAQVEQKIRGADPLYDTDAFLKSIDKIDFENKAKNIANQIIKSSKQKSMPLQVNLGTNYSSLSMTSPVKLIDQLKKGLRQANGSFEQADFGGDLGSILDEDNCSPFDLKMRYGFQERDGGYTRTIKDCVIFGEAETVSASAGISDDMSSSAQPILEIYSFFARDIEVTQG